MLLHFGSMEMVNMNGSWLNCLLKLATMSLFSFHTLKRLVRHQSTEGGIWASPERPEHLETDMTLIRLSVEVVMSHYFDHLKINAAYQMKLFQV